MFELGRRVFDDGCYLTERTLVSIGDHAVLNAGSKVQCHSQEDGAFKSDHTTIGADCTIGVGAFVHYGVTMGDGAVLAADSFLMKGEEVPPHARWGGNPAAEIPAEPADSRIRRPTDQVPALVRSAGRHRLIVEPAHTQPVRSAGRHRRTVTPDRPSRDVAAGTATDDLTSPTSSMNQQDIGPVSKSSRTARTIRDSRTRHVMPTVAPALVGASSPMASVNEGTIRWEH